MWSTRYSIFFVVSLIALGILPSHNAVAQTPNLTVTVTGAGPSYDEARTDAVRKALQYALKQLVVVDRIVSENDVLRDRVLSTSNGYVEKYQEKRVRETAIGFTVDAEIAVSASRIEGFLGIVAGGGGKINGSLLGQEIQRRAAQDAAVLAQAKARGEIFNRLFENFPQNAMEFKLLKVTLDERNNRLILDLERSYKPGFLKAVVGTLEAFSIHNCEWRYSPAGQTGRDKDGFIFMPFSWNLSKYVACGNFDQNSRDKIMSPHIPPTSKEVWFGQVCIGDDTTATAKCFILDHGIYLADDIRNTSSNKEGGSFTLLATFLDANRQNALTHNQCITLNDIYGNKISDNGSFVAGLESITQRTSNGYQAAHSDYIGDKAGMDHILHFNPSNTVIQVSIDATNVDLQRAAHFVAVAGLRGPWRQDKENLMVGLTSSRDLAMEPCDLLGDAVRQYMLSIAKKNWEKAVPVGASNTSGGLRQGDAAPANFKAERPSTAAIRLTKDDVQTDPFGCNSLQDNRTIRVVDITPQGTSAVATVVCEDDKWMANMKFIYVLGEHKGKPMWMLADQKFISQKRK